MNKYVIITGGAGWASGLPDQAGEPGQRESIGFSSAARYVVLPVVEAVQS
jgi:hypothetical protein